MSDLARLIQASAHHLPMIDDKSIQCVVTSPPYFGLRKYDGAQDAEWSQVSYSPMAGLPPLTVPAMTCPLGNEPTIEAFIGHLILCAREWRRVLKDDGVCWINLGDSFSGANGNGYKQSKDKNNRTGGPGHNFSLRRESKRYEGLPPKNLMLIPARFALAMQADGWILRSEVIWHKPNPMPESVTDRPTKAHEQIYLFSKQERYFYDADAIREPMVTADGLGGVFNRQSKHSVIGNQASGQSHRVSGDKGRNMRTVWKVATQQYAGAHFACFPPSLVEPMIKAGSRVGDTVLDPFSGSGTALRVAVKLGRKAIGVDLSEKYLDELAPERLTVQMEMVS